MKKLDVFLQSWRIRKAAPFVPDGARLLDIGCHRGELFERLRGRIRYGLGIDPEAPEGGQPDFYRLVRGTFPDDVPKGEESFDCITMLAALEHFSAPLLAATPELCSRYLRPDGLVVITVPSPAVDRILELLKRLRLLDTMDFDAHHGFEPDTVMPLFARRFRCLARSRFQLGLNNLFVFQRRSES